MKKADWVSGFEAATGTRYYYMHIFKPYISFAYGTRSLTFLSKTETPYTKANLAAAIEAVGKKEKDDADVG